MVEKVPVEVWEEGKKTQEFVEQVKSRHQAWLPNPTPAARNWKQEHKTWQGTT